MSCKSRVVDAQHWLELNKWYLVVTVNIFWDSTQSGEGQGGTLLKSKEKFPIMWRAGHPFDGAKELFTAEVLLTRLAEWKLSL